MRIVKFVMWVVLRVNTSPSSIPDEAIVTILTWTKQYSLPSLRAHPL